MRIKRSGRVVLTTMLALLFYTALVVWHNKPPASNYLSVRQNLVVQLVQEYPALAGYISQIKMDSGAAAFFSVGLASEQAWPRALKRACYPDPLAAWRSEERRVGKECRSRWSPYQ